MSSGYGVSLPLLRRWREQRLNSGKRVKAMA
jgi:hypothetical protein